MPTVQFEVISAPAASGAPVLGVSAALVVGLRRAQAARHATEAASVSAREQWRNSNRREAAGTFLVEVERQLEEAAASEDRRPPEDLNEVTRMRRALWRSLAIVRIEGPQALSDAAVVVVVVQQTVDRIPSHTMANHRRRRPKPPLRAPGRRGE